MGERLIRGFGGPGRYLQGPGLISRLPEFSGLYGSSVFLLIDSFFKDTLAKEIALDFQKSRAEFNYDIFTGEVSELEISRIKSACEKFSSQVLIGVGGGKTLDAVKAVANDLGKKLIIAPTTASTDAPCSSLSVIYKDNGEHSHVRWYVNNPEMVLVDTKVVLQAPIRFMIAGIGDALSTYFEAEANRKSNSTNYINLETHGGFMPTRTGIELARFSYEILRREATKALDDIRSGNLTESVENIIEANTLLSGLGFENNGCAGAHSINDGITALPQGVKALHGERVAFGILVQFVAENVRESEFDDLASFCRKVGLPITLENMNIEANQANIELIAKASMHSNWDREPFTVKWQDVASWISEANRRGHSLS
ncbi:MAG: glycerol dehydrogenase [Actinobacteria bacterium]|nr:glycerol dehydrogenase [Actinomycetota bacterium]